MIKKKKEAARSPLLYLLGAAVVVYVLLVGTLQLMHESSSAHISGVVHVQLQEFLGNSSQPNLRDHHVDYTYTAESAFIRYNITNDPNEPYPTVILPYNGRIDPFYQIPSDGTNLWDDDPAIPAWMKAYFNWHKWRRQTWNPDDWAQDRWLIMQCLADQDPQKCGGTADRLKPVPTMLRLAYESHRMLLIRWTRPATLESFLVPPKGGVDWRVPDWMAGIMADKLNGRRFVPTTVIQKYFTTNLTLMRTRYQSTDAGKAVYDGAVAPHEPSFDEVFGPVWRILFRPSTAVAQIIKDELHRMDLVPGHYVAAHLRALYAVEERPIGRIRQWTEFALNCASSLRPGAPIFFASDSSDATAYAPIYAASQKGRATTHTSDPNPPLHLDMDPGWKQRNPSEYYDTFVDLYLIALAGCVTFNMGGYGNWGLLIGGNVNCSINQKTKKATMQPAIMCPWHAPRSQEAELLPERSSSFLFVEPML